MNAKSTNTLGGVEISGGTERVRDQCHDGGAPRSVPEFAGRRRQFEQPGECRRFTLGDDELGRLPKAPDDRPPVEALFLGELPSPACIEGGGLRLATLPVCGGPEGERIGQVEGLAESFREAHRVVHVPEALVEVAPRQVPPRGEAVRRHAVVGPEALGDHRVSLGLVDLDGTEGMLETVVGLTQVVACEAELHPTEQLQGVVVVDRSDVEHPLGEGRTEAGLSPVDVIDREPRQCQSDPLVVAQVLAELSGPFVRSLDLGVRVALPP